MAGPLASLLRWETDLDHDIHGVGAEPPPPATANGVACLDSAPQPPRSRTIYFVAGDVSGDLHGSHLARAIRAAAPDARLVGVGGDGMRAAGVELQIDTTQLSVVGVWDALRMGRQIVRTFRQVQALISTAQPDLVVLIDSETVVVPAARWLKRRGLQAVFFFPPQIWFWGRWRRHRVAPLARRVISAFRPEAELLSRRRRRHGLDRPSAAGHCARARRRRCGSGSDRSRSVATIGRPDAGQPAARD